jgi:hypothetical protein
MIRMSVYDQRLTFGRIQLEIQWGGDWAWVIIQVAATGVDSLFKQPLKKPWWFLREIPHRWDHLIRGCIFSEQGMAYMG